MRHLAGLLASFAVCITSIIVGPEICRGQLAPGNAAPVFSLQDLGGKSYDLSTMKDQSMIILYFLDVESRPSIEGLLSLDSLAKQYKDAHMIMWCITLSSEDKVSTFIDRIKPGFPILLDKSGVSDLYQASFVLPTTCIIGSGLVFLDYFQGGGKNTEIMILKSARRQLQRMMSVQARAIREQVVKKNPPKLKDEKEETKNLKGKMFKAYDVVKKGIWKMSLGIKKHTIEPISNITFKKDGDKETE